MYCDRCGAQPRANARFCPGCGADLAQVRSALHETPPGQTTIQAVGSVLGNRYVIEQEIGRGGMGIVYKALDRELDMPVALKVLHPRIADRPEAVTQLRDEALAAMRLTHPNIVRLHNFENTPQAKYLLMEYVPGQSLGKMLSNGLAAGFTERDVVRIGQQVCDGLAAAHQAGIIHRDIKPSNILITPDGRAKILDFGIAHVQEPGSPQGGGRAASAGTPTYMSPEQFRGEKLDGRTDVYALGATMYEILATHPPFVGNNLKQQHLEDPAEPIPGVSDWLNEIVLRCLEKNPRDRWGTAEKLREALEGKTDPSAGLRAVRQTDHEPEWRRVARERERRERMLKEDRRAAAAALSNAELSSPEIASFRVSGRDTGGLRPRREGDLPPAPALNVQVAADRPGMMRGGGLTPNIGAAMAAGRADRIQAPKVGQYVPPNSRDGTIRWGIPSGILQFSVGAAFVVTVAVFAASFVVSRMGLVAGPFVTQVVLGLTLGVYWSLAEIQSRQTPIFAGAGALVGLLVGALYSAQPGGADASPIALAVVDAIRVMLLGGALGAVMGRARGVPAAIGLAAGLGIFGGLVGTLAQMVIRLLGWYPTTQLDLVGGTILTVMGMTVGAAIGASAVVTPNKMRL